MTPLEAFLLTEKKAISVEDFIANETRRKERNGMGHKITVDEAKDVILNNCFQITIASAANAGKGRKALLYEIGNGLFSITSDGLTSFTRVVEDAVKLYNDS